ncbi:universal stress protein [Colwellia echini]|uniref:Universal stress protein n=1 Tax=Colwellia echini TaxID=1982103 RepID=A0ABY3N1M5_9GAMM|nr:universal stress protein [Colwellia echini]TYK67370.1 universal stress protein [Colwellia echini]
MYKHILFAVELNENKRYIEEKVAKLQQLTQAKVSVLHVVEKIPNAYYGTGMNIAPELEPINTLGIEKIQQDRAKELLQPLADRLMLNAENLHIALGYNISEEILSFAENSNVDLIITGSHGVHGLKLLLGSTANSILHGAKCDVLAVRYKE